MFYPSTADTYSLDFSVKPYTWIRKADMPVAMTHGHVANPNNHTSIYVQAGMNSSSENSDVVMKYHSGNDTWNTLDKAAPVTDGYTVTFTRFSGTSLITYKYVLGKVFFTSTDKDNVGKAKDTCLLYTSPSPRDRQKSRMPSSA